MVGERIEKTCRMSQLKSHWQLVSVMLVYWWRKIADCSEDEDKKGVNCTVSESLSHLGLVSESPGEMAVVKVGPEGAYSVEGALKNCIGVLDTSGTYL